MKWGELKKNVLDLGFDDSPPDPDVMITACNRAINLIMKTVVERYEDYFVKTLSDDSYTWELPYISQIKEDTLDKFTIQIPDKVIDLVPLLAAHYAWLDDDVQKATIYWNEYDDLKNQLIADMDRPRKHEIYTDFTLGW